MSTTFTYGSYLFTPAPLINYSKERVRDSLNNKLYDRVTLTCNGALVNQGQNPTKEGRPLGDPGGTLIGDFGGLDEDLFKPLVSGLKDDYQELRITHASGVFVSGVYPRISSFATEGDSTWVTLKRYSVVFEWDEIPAGNDFVVSFNDNWSWQEQDDDTTAVTHTVSAKGLNTTPSGASNALNNARDFVALKLGIDKIPTGLPDKVYQLYLTDSYIQRQSSETANVGDGTYSNTEQFIFASGVANTYVDRNDFSLSVDNKGIGTITVKGEITGGGATAAERDANALAGWLEVDETLFPQASGVHSSLGYTRQLAPEPISRSLSRNKNSGKITYDYQYSDKLNDSLAVNIIDASWNVQRTDPVQVFASIAVPGKTTGPVWQDIKTVTEGTYVISGDVLGTTIEDAVTYAQKIVNTYGGQSVGTERRISAKSINPKHQDNSVNFSITWTFKNDAADSLLEI